MALSTAIAAFVVRRIGCDENGQQETSRCRGRHPTYLKDAMAARFRKFMDDRELNVVVAGGIRAEVQNPNTEAAETGCGYFITHDQCFSC